MEAWAWERGPEDGSTLGGWLVGGQRLEKWEGWEVLMGHENRKGKEPKQDPPGAGGPGRGVQPECGLEAGQALTPAPLPLAQEKAVC